MNENTIRAKIYQKYILQWMIDHDHTLPELIDILAEIDADGDGATDIFELYSTFVDEQGFGSEIWACYDEFLENEYLDSTYILSFIHRPKDRRDYINDSLMLKREEQ